jgi:hypothetical protein
MYSNLKNGGELLALFEWLLKGAKYEFVGKKIKTNMESSRGENQSIISKEYIISW